MLTLARLVKSELEKVYLNSIYKEKYKYYQFSSYTTYIMTIDDNDWEKLEYCSVDKSGNILGFFRAYIERDSHKITEIGIISFIDEEKSDKHLICGVDLFKFLKMIYDHPAVNKIEWSVIVDPDYAFSKKRKTELFYDKIVKKFNGKIVGIFTKTIKLRDGKFYDRKYYEIIK